MSKQPTPKQPVASVRFTKITKGYYSFPVWEFNLPAGWTCPFAQACLTKADRETGKQINGPEQEFRCYAAVAERFPAVRQTRWANFDALRGKGKEEMTAMISDAMPAKAGHIRIHGGGDFFNQDYFDAWLEVCRMFPQKTFWAFTKSISFWVARLGMVPANLTMQASYGGKQDNLIALHGLKFAKVFGTFTDANASGLPLDTDDTLAMTGSQSFALLDNYSRDKSRMLSKKPGAAVGLTIVHWTKDSDSPKTTDLFSTEGDLTL